ncbi:MAG: Long-chain-fatty-acid--CoA ligase [Syntrophorhabdus sp. PtaU1.Bin058]|nr:MAG: Long-chain-fatty-acid--CoA ligase [Syntrophorhabdus sp. PtaU1.Bin058]
MTISEMLERNGRMYPDKIALIERIPSKNIRKEISWKQFDERVNRIANALTKKGLKKGDIVIHWMMNSIEWLEAYFGIIRTGAVVAPLNFRFTEKDFKYCVEIAEPKLVILDEMFVDRIEDVDDKILSKDRYIVRGGYSKKGMDNFEEMIIQSDPNPFDMQIGCDDPCGLYFTSGTTGSPKPIVLTHNNMEHAAIIEVIHGLRKPGDRFAILKPLYHTGDYIHWLSSLILGESAVIQSDKITPQTIFEVMEQEACTVAMMLVPWIQDILAELETGKLRKDDYDLSKWRLIMYGAQPVPPNLIRRFKEEFPHMLIEVNYGLTEGTGPQCIHLGIENEHKVGAIGKPGFNWEAKVVDENGKDVPRGEVGEIIVKGNGVMREYYKNPEKTAETIKYGWLYTGDMAKIDEDGFFWIVDRKKDVIISGGENIYPVEIEDILQRHPKVHDVGVIGLPDERLGEVVVAVVKLEQQANESPRTEKEIIQYCETNLPRYKRPKRIVFDDVPRNPTGKIEKFKMRKKYA